MLGEYQIDSAKRSTIDECHVVPALWVEDFGWSDFEHAGCANICDCYILSSVARQSPPQLLSCKTVIFNCAMNKYRIVNMSRVICKFLIEKPNIFVVTCQCHLSLQILSSTRGFC